MLTTIIEAVVTGCIAGVFAGMSSLATVKVHLLYLRRDVDRLSARFKHLEHIIFKTQRAG